MASSDIVVSPVGGKADLKAFINLPKRLYAGHKGYIPHLDSERREAFTPGKNPLFGHVEVQFFLARRAGRVVGRITAQIDRAYLERYTDDTGHFGCVAAEDDPAIFAALFEAAEGWLRSKGMKRATGPFSLSVNEEVGLLIWGFDSRPVLLTPYDPPYSGARVEACGYAKIKDLLSYDYDVQNAPVTIGAKLMARAGMAGRVKVRTANMKMFDAEVRTLVGIFNDAWSDNWGFVPFTQAEIDHASKAFGPVIVPDLAVFVEVDDEAVAFIVALTNFNEAIVDFNGSLNPLNLAKLLWRLKIAGVGSTRVPLMGVKKKFRNHPLMGAGLAMMAIDHLRSNGKRLGKTSAELGWILEDNKATNNIIRSVGGVHYKTHRIYEKAPRLTTGANAPVPGVARPHSAFAPLANRAFLALWTANVLSNTGGWMASTGAAWEMTSLTSEPIFVALLAASGTLPMFLFCFFAGILADRFDRRLYIIGCQIWMMGVAAVLAFLAFSGQLTHWNLLALTFCMGLGNAMNAPAWHAIVPEIVSGPLLRPAIALNSAGFNLARTVGPVVGQILLGLVGVFLLFAINACTYIGVIFAMSTWKRSAEARSSQRREGFAEAARTGIAFVRNSGELKAIFARGLCFFAPGIAISTLLPVIGRFELGLDEFSFGILYAVFGVGAVAGAILMPLLNRLLSPDRANIWAMGIQAAATLIAALAMTPYVVGACVALSGACWITVNANNGAAVQMMLPNFMRARGMAVHQMVFFGSMVVGSLLWGKIATLLGTQAALIISAATLVPFTVLAASIRLPGSSLPRA